MDRRVVQVEDGEMDPQSESGEPLVPADILIDARGTFPSYDQVQANIEHEVVRLQGLPKRRRLAWVAFGLGSTAAFCLIPGLVAGAWWMTIAFFALWLVGGAPIAFIRLWPERVGPRFMRSMVWFMGSEPAPTKTPRPVDPGPE